MFVFVWALSSLKKEWQKKKKKKNGKRFSLSEILFLLGKAEVDINMN